MCTAGIRLVTDEDVQKSGDSGVIYIISVIQMIDLSMSYTYCVTKSTIAQTKQRLCNAWWNMVVSRICSSATGRYHGARQCGFRVRPSAAMARGNVAFGCVRPLPWRVETSHTAGKWLAVGQREKFLWLAVGLVRISVASWGGGGAPGSRAHPLPYKCIGMAAPMSDVGAARG